MEKKKKDTEINIPGLLKTSNTITESFKKLKFVTILCIVGTVLCSILCVVYSISRVMSMGDKVYVLNSGQVLTADRQSTSVTRADEVRDQAVRLHEYLFSVTPNRDMVTRNIEEALKISDRSVYDYYRDVDETGFYRRMAQTGSIQDVVVDSVKTDVSRYPYPVITYVTLTVTRPSSMVRTRLVSRCSMVEVGRNPKNLHGLLIEKFEVVENTKIDERKRN